VFVPINTFVWAVPPVSGITKARVETYTSQTAPNKTIFTT